jgi:hypothetical protein
VEAAGAGDRRDVLTPGEQPGQGQLGDCDALGRGHVAGLAHGLDVLLEIVGLPAGVDVGMSVTSCSSTGLAGWENSETAAPGPLICMVPDVLRQTLSRELLFVVEP